MSKSALPSLLMMEKSLGLKTIGCQVQRRTRIAVMCPTCVLNCEVQQDHVAKFNRMYRHHSAFPQVAPPILISMLVIDPVLDVVGKEILQFNGSPELESNPRIFPEPRYEPL